MRKELTLQRKLLSVGRNTLYRGTDSDCGKEIILQSELLSVGTHFTKGVTVCVKELTFQRDRLCLWEGTHFIE